MEQPIIKDYLKLIVLMFDPDQKLREPAQEKLIKMVSTRASELESVFLTIFIDLDDQIYLNYKKYLVTLHSYLIDSQNSRKEIDGVLLKPSAGFIQAIVNRHFQYTRKSGLRLLTSQWICKLFAAVDETIWATIFNNILLSIYLAPNLDLLQLLYSILIHDKVPMSKYDKIDNDKLKSSPVATLQHPILLKILLNISKRQHKCLLTTKQLLSMFPNHKQTIVLFLCETHIKFKQAQLLQILTYFNQIYLKPKVYESNNTGDFCNSVEKGMVPTMIFSSIHEIVIKMITKLIILYIRQTSALDYQIEPIIQKYSLKFLEWLCGAITLSRDQEGNIRIAQMVSTMFITMTQFKNLNKKFIFYISKQLQTQVFLKDFCYRILGHCLSSHFHLIDYSKFFDTMQHQLSHASSSSFRRSIYFFYKNLVLSIGKNNIFRQKIHEIMISEAEKNQDPDTLIQIIEILFELEQQLDQYILISLINKAHNYDSYDETSPILSIFIQKLENSSISFFNLSEIKPLFYNYHNVPTFIRSQYLEILIIIIKKGDFTEYTFTQAFVLLKSISVFQLIEIEFYCKAACELFKVYIKKYFLIQGYLQYNKQLLQIFSKYTCQSAYEFFMELINVPLRNHEFLVTLLDFLVENLIIHDPRLYDLLEVFIILYPVTAKQKSKAILDTLSKLQRREYFRFYFRLRPPYKPVPLFFRPDTVIQLKWVLLSGFRQLGFINGPNPSSKQYEIQQLTNHMQNLSLENTHLKTLAKQLHECSENPHHWIAEWPNEFLHELLKRDFQNFYILKITPLYFHYFQIDYQY